MKIVGGKWLKDRNRYDSEMCLANGWECIQGRHYDVLINNKKVEVKKTKSSSAIIKLQQLAEIVLQPELSDIFYLFIRTDKMQNSILDAININESSMIEGQEYVRSTYSLNSMINSYEKLFLGEHNAFHRKTISNDLMVLAPWCHIEKKSIYSHLL